MKRFVFAVTAASILTGLAAATQAETVIVKIETGTATGTLRAAAYDNQASFDSGNIVAGVTSAANGGLATLAFVGLKPGAYGIAVYLDENGNEKLDTNLLGAPTEPFGFSMNPKIGFSAPKFNEFRFEHDGTDKELTIALNGN